MGAYANHRKKWDNCKRCELFNCRYKMVFARGKLPCEVLFIGEAPGPSENAIGTPFIGPAGKLLDRQIEEATELSRPFRWAITNLVCCIPTVNGEKLEEPPDKCIAACRPRLREFIKLADPRIIVCVGNCADEHVPFIRNIEYACIIHPAAILRMDVSMQGLVHQRSVITLADVVSF